MRSFSPRPTPRAGREEIIARYPEGRSRSALLPLLHLVQSEEGYVSAGRRRVLRRGARPDQGRGRRGRDLLHHVQAPPDRRLAGQRLHQHDVRRARRPEVYDALSEHLGVGHDETTADGTITLEHAECLAACDYAPGDDGQLRVLRQGRRRTRARRWSTQLQRRRAADADPRRAAVHAQGDGACSSPASPTSATSAVADGRRRRRRRCAGAAPGRSEHGISRCADCRPATPRSATPQGGATSEVTQRRVPVAGGADAS